jgi:hypothetical protein
MAPKLNRSFVTPATNHAGEIIGTNFWTKSLASVVDKPLHSVENLALTILIFFPI